ncbi:MAG: transglutaminase family protein [Flavobacteriales bacterium]|nr:MAG: transglutaminase family protein [Flavobacteriales bacterium]
MSLAYSIHYTAENSYEHWVHKADWQFLIIPETNATQKFVSVEFSNSINAVNQFSINGYGFPTIRIHPKQQFKEISFEASFKLIKKEVNPYDFKSHSNAAEAFRKIEELDFKVDFESFLYPTPYTAMPSKYQEIFRFDSRRTIFENLQELNHWTYLKIYFKTGVTDVNTTVNEIIEKRHGVCQDFAHLFCAIARLNGIPARYVSGFLHQGNGYFGDSQMHAWVEAFVPFVGWLGFDPTNDILAGTNHIKVSHGKDYKDCAPLKGVVFSKGSNETRHTVQVLGQLQQ